MGEGYRDSQTPTRPQRQPSLPLQYLICCFLKLPAADRFQPLGVWVRKERLYPKSGYFQYHWKWCLHSFYSFFLSFCRRKPVPGAGLVRLDPTAEVLMRSPLVCSWGYRMQPRGLGTKGVDTESMYQRGLQLCAWWESSMSAWRSQRQYQRKRQPNAHSGCAEDLLILTLFSEMQAQRSG